MFCDALQEPTSITGPLKQKHNPPPCNLPEPNQPCTPIDQNNVQPTAKFHVMPQLTTAAPKTQHLTCASSTAAPCDHAQRNPCRPDGQALGDGRSASSPLDCDADQSTTCRTSCIHGRGQEHHPEAAPDRAQQGCQEEGQPGQMGRGSSYPHHGQHDHCPDLCDGRAAYHSGDAGQPHGKDEFWHPPRQDLCRGVVPPQELCSVGNSDHAGVRRCELASPEVCHVGHELQGASNNANTPTGRLSGGGNRSRVLRSPGDSSDASFSMVESDHQAELEQLRQELEATKKEKMELELAVGRVKSRRETWALLMPKMLRLWVLIPNSTAMSTISI